MTTPSFLSLLKQRAAESPERRAYLFLAAGKETASLTFSELDRRARAVGARLTSAGARGERVVLLLPPGTEYIAAFFGCQAAGAVAVPAYPPRQNHHLNRLLAILDDARPRVVLTTAALATELAARLSGHPGHEGCCWLACESIADDEAEGWIEPPLAATDLALLQYTSASTSAPKGVMVSHGNLLHNQLLMTRALGHDAATVIVSWLPLFHDMGLIGNVLAALYHGVPCVLMAPMDFLRRPRLWLEAITRYRGTFSGAPDFGYQLAVEKIGPAEREGLDLASWKAAFNGSEPVRAATLASFARTFAPCGFRAAALFPCYGLAEHTLFAAGRFHTAAVTSFERGSVEASRPVPGAGGMELTSCGPPAADTRLLIVDPQERRPLAEGRIGEIWLASGSVAQGYWGRLEESAATFRATLALGGGPFLRTGDLGFLHGGELHVTGRLKDLIILRGRNVVPQDLEQTVERVDPAIRPAFVAAVAVEAGGEERVVIAAEVRREARHGLAAEALIENIRSRIGAEHAVEVAAVLLLAPNSLPKTSSGKTQRGRVRAAFLANELDLLAAWQSEGLKAALAAEAGPRALPLPPREELEEWLSERLARRLRRPAAALDRGRPIASYGLDSVVAAAFVAEIEETFGVTLGIDGLFRAEPSLSDLARLLKGGGSPEAAPPAPTPEPGANGHGKGADQSQAALHLVPAAPPANTNGNGNGKGKGNVRRGSWPRPDHAFRKYVNPEVGRLLAQMAMDKTFVRGEGSWLVDSEGRRYLDFLAQYGALPFGFNPPRIWAALNAVQASCEPSFVQPSNLDAAGELARRLLAAAPPGLAYVTYANSGAEAIEAAIKLARSTTDRSDILAAQNGFHGKTLGALSATDKEKYQRGFGAPVAGFHYVPYGDLQELRRALSSRRYAAFLVEPIQGEGGIVEPPAGYLRLAARACRESGTLLVVDEIQTGLGRTGRMFACQAEGFTPDVITVAKALGGGLVPIGACLATAAAYNADFALKHTSTFAGNTLACRAGLATLDLLEEDEGALLDQVSEHGARLKAGLLELKARFPDLVGEVRGRGFLLGLTFGLNRGSVEGGLLGYLGENEVLTGLVVSHLLDVEGIRVGYTLNRGGVLRIEPPLTASWEECAFFLTGLERVLARLESLDLASLTAHLTGLDRALPADIAAKPSPRLTRRRLAPRPEEGRFAFLVHPLEVGDYRKLDPTLAPLSERQLETLSSAIGDNFDPFVIGETRITAADGRSACGEFILVPRRPAELLAMPYDDAFAEIRDAARLGQKRGARIIGLGAFTSVVTRGGLTLARSGLPPLTTGNSYTAAAGRQAVERAALGRGWRLAERTVAILGAGGAIGAALSRLLATRARRLILLGNPAHGEESRRRLLAVAGRIVASLGELEANVGLAPGSLAEKARPLALGIPPELEGAGLVELGAELVRRSGLVEVSVDAAGLLPEADIVVCCTSSTERLVRSEHLRPRAVVCDISRPSNVAEDVAERRPDVLRLDGGIVRLPSGSTLGFNASLAPGQAYACMAETMMLALTQRYEDASLGFELGICEVLELERLAQELGFELALDQTIFEQQVSRRNGAHFPRLVDFGGARA